MDLLDYGSSDEDEEKTAGGGVKRGREGEGLAHPAASSTTNKVSRLAATGDAPHSRASQAPSHPVARSFKTLDADVRSASSAARRTANALFERRAGAGAQSQMESGGGGAGAGGGGGMREGDFAPAAYHTEQQQYGGHAPAPQPPRAGAPLLDARTLGLLDARSRRELGLDKDGNLASGGMDGSSGSGSGSGSGGGYGMYGGGDAGGGGGAWGVPSKAFGDVGVLEVSGAQVRGRGWEMAALELAQASAAAAAARKGTTAVVGRVWNHATGQAEQSAGGASKAQKGKHQINALAAAAQQHSIKLADRAAEASIQAALMRR